MKKAAALFLFFAFFVSANVSAEDVTASSRITQVTVYPDSALLTRRASIKLNSGTHKVVFPDIIPDVDENSLRVAVDNAQARIFAAALKKEFLEAAPSEKIRQLKEEIEKLEDEQRSLHGLKNVLSDQKKFLDSVRLFSEGQIPKDLVTRMPPAKELDDTLKFLDTRLKENSSNTMEADLKIRHISRKLDALRRELAQVSGPYKKVKRSIVVDMQTARPVDVNLDISYLVPAANWQPLYDARANFDKSEVELVSYGLVRQKTGEDWDNVEISLSTAKPAIGGRMPYVSPWFLRPFKHYFEDKVMKSAIRAQDAGMQFEAFSKEESMPLEAAAPLMAQAVEQGVAVVYKLPEKATIKSDAEENKLPVSSQVLKAEFEYSAYPRAVLFAYLGSRVRNAEGLQLLAGRVNIFLDGGFVGSSSIDNVGPGEEFDLYLGVDENVKVKRDQIEKKVDETLIGGIPSPVKKTVYKFKLTAENYKSRQVKVKLFESMPVPEDDRIKVRINQVSIEPNEKDWKDRKGVYLWDLQLAPKEKKEIFYTYTIEHPRDMRIEGLN